MTATPERVDQPLFADPSPLDGKAAKKASKKALKKARKQGEMTIVQHLEELRRRILLSLLSVVLGAGLGWFLYAPTLRLLVDPYKRATGSRETRLIFNGVAEPFLIKLKVSFFIGIAIALPFVMLQLWRFVTPGLHRRERHYAVPFLVSSVFLFALGAFFAYLTFPTALKFLLGFGGPDLVPLLTAERYLNFIFLMFLAFGLSFEFPVLLQFLVIANVVSSRKLRDFRRWAILFITIFAAVITPSQDPLSMLLMAVPMVIFYEAVIWISRLVFKK